MYLSKEIVFLLSLFFTRASVGFSLFNLNETTVHIPNIPSNMVWWGYRHSDDEMRTQIRDHQTAMKDVAFGHLLRRQRCSYDNKSQEFKYGLIERGHEKGLYSAAIRDELKNKRLYPIIGIDEQEHSYVVYVCCFH